MLPTLQNEMKWKRNMGLYLSQTVLQSLVSQRRVFLRVKIPCQNKSKIPVLIFHCQKGGRTTIALSLLTQLLNCEYLVRSHLRSGSHFYLKVRKRRLY